MTFVLWPGFLGTIHRFTSFCVTNGFLLDARVLDSSKAEKKAVAGLHNLCWFLVPRYGLYYHYPLKHKRLNNSVGVCECVTLG